MRFEARFLITWLLVTVLAGAGAALAEPEASGVRAISRATSPQPLAEIRDGKLILKGGMSISLATLPPGESLVIDVVVDIDDPLPGGTTELSSQVDVAGSNFTTEPSDDPATPADDDATITGIAPGADLQISKTDGAANAIPGGQVTYTIVASNAGPNAVTDAAVADTFPAVLSNCSYTSVAAGGATGNTAAGSGDIGDVLSLPAGASVTYMATCDVDSTATGSLVNTATISSVLLPDPSPANNSATDADTLVVTADLEISKANGSANSIPGQQTTYTIVATNQGPSTVTDASVTDTFPGSLSNCSFTSVAAGGATGNTAAGTGNIADTLDMPPSSSVTYTATCDIDDAATGSLVNTASISSVLAAETDGSDNSATDTDTLTVTADLEITKSNGVTNSTAGVQTTYTIVASNQGPSTVTDASVTDTFPASLSNCSYTSVAAGGATGNTAAGSGDIADTLSMPPSSMVTYTATCDIDPAATGSLVNTASISSAIATETDGSDNSATDTDTLEVTADLEITKSNGVATSTAGTMTTYTIVATNQGPSTVSDAAVADSFPAILQSCTYTSVAAGGATGNTAAGSGDIADTLSMPPSSSVTYTATCGIDPAATGSLSNTATISSALANESDPGDNSATDTDTLEIVADLQVSKDNGTATSIPGTQTTYTITVSSLGPSTATDAAVADSFPAALSNCTFTSVAAGGATGNTAAGSGDIADTLNMPPSSSVTYTATCDIDPTATGSLSNTATVTSAADSSTGNNSATDTDTLEVTADLEISKDDGVTSVAAGGSTTYTIVVSNQGPSTVGDAAVADAFPAALLNCSYTSVAAGGASGNTAAGSGDIADTLTMPPSSSVTYTATCDIDTNASGSVSNTATVSSAATDPDPGDNSATDTNTVAALADLQLEKTVSPSDAAAGDPLTYTITVTNAGPGDAENVVVTDTLPAGVTLVSTSGCAEDPAGVPACTLGTVSASGSAQFTIDVTVDASPPATIVNSASVTSDNPDPDSGNNSDSATVTTDTVPPQVVSVSWDGGTIEDCDSLRANVTRLEVVFNEPMAISTLEGGAAPGADVIENYWLVRPGVDRSLQTTSCGALGGDDFRVLLGGLSYDADTPAAPEATVTLERPAQLRIFNDDLFRLIVCGNITDAGGNALDGDGDGMSDGSDDFSIDFRIDRLNRFENGNFDCDLGGWDVDPPGSLQVTQSAEDFEGSQQSGSARTAFATEESFGLSQCVDIDAIDRPYRLSSRVRVDAGLGIQVVASRACSFFDQAACTGTELGQVQDLLFLNDTGGVFVDKDPAFELDLPAGSLSAACSLDLQALDDATFDAFADALFVGFGDDPIFDDGFESGDLSAWSSAAGN